MKQYRFGLCLNLDAKLIERIKQKANGGSQNETVRFLLRFWFEQEQRQDVTLERQNMATERIDNDDDVINQDDDLSGLDAAFKDM